MSVQIIPIVLSKDVGPGYDLVEILLKTKAGRGLKDNDILVFTQKIISKQEGQKIDLSLVKPTLLATGIASAYNKDPKIV